MTKTLRWNMIFRTGDQPAQLLVDSGFGRRDVWISEEPCGAHVFGIAKAAGTHLVF